MEKIKIIIYMNIKLKKHIYKNEKKFKKVLKK